MINLQSVAVNQSGSSVSKYASNQAVGKSFADYLENGSDKQLAIPNKWCLDTDKYGSGVDKAVEYMSENLGIDPYNRTPTYEITNKQLQWLKSRHDLNDVYKTSTGTCEDGCCGWRMSWWDENFLSDLVYLNVISPEDAKKFGWIAFPKSESGKVHAATDIGGVNSEKMSIADIAAKVLQNQQSYIDLIYAKYNNNLSLMTKQDIEYLETAQKLLEKDKIWYDILLQLSD